MGAEGSPGIVSQWETARTKGRWLTFPVASARAVAGEGLPWRIMGAEGALHSCDLWVGCALKLLGIGKQILQDDGGEDVGCCGAKIGFFVVPFVSGPRGVPAR